MEQKPRQTKTTPPTKGYRDLEVLYSSGDVVTYRMYAEMYKRTMEHFMGHPSTTMYTFVVAYALDWRTPDLGVPEEGKSYINLNQVCSIDIIGYDNEKTE